MTDKLSFTKRLQLEQQRRFASDRIRRHYLRQLFWECTLRCNLNCRHCGSDCRCESELNDMPLADFLRVLDDVRKVYDPSRILVNTTGGEPLMRRDIEECGREITRRGFLWGMVSNAMLLSEERIDRLIAAGLRTIGISLDGPEAEHNWMRGNEHSFNRAMQAISVLKRKRIVWDVITCVNLRNIGLLNQMKEMLIAAGVKQWRLITVFPSGRAATDAEMQISSEQLRELMEFIVATRKEGRIKVSFGCESFLGKYEKEVRDYTFFCQAGINVASILADGSISGCLSIRSDYHQGNIYTDDFVQTWEQKFDCYRNREWKRTGECGECEMWRYCEGGGMHLRKSDKSLAQCLYLNLFGSSR